MIAVVVSTVTGNSDEMTRDSVRIDMMQKKARIRQLVLMAAIPGMIFFTAGAQASVDAGNSKSPERSDVINIDTMSTFGPIERSPVEFLHDKHTQAVEKMGKDCLACHLQDDGSGRLSIRFMRLGDTDKQDSNGYLSCRMYRVSQ